MQDSGKSRLRRRTALMVYLVCPVVLFTGCATRRPSQTYAEWKAKQELRAQNAKMLKAAEGVTFKPVSK